MLSEKDKAKYVELKIKVSRGIIRFWQDWYDFVGAKENATKILTDDAGEHIKSITGDMLCQVCDSVFFDGINEVVEKYGLHACAKIQGVKLADGKVLSKPITIR